jgi:hypothetical protein
MKSLVIAAVAVLVAAAPVVAQDNKANPAAPGQDRVCLVTTGTPNSWDDDDIVDTKWLPRKAGEAQAEKDPSTMQVFDYSTDPLVVDGTFDSAEELCNEHFAN